MLLPYREAKGCFRRRRLSFASFLRKLTKDKEKILPAAGRRLANPACRAIAFKRRLVDPVQFFFNKIRIQFINVIDPKSRTLRHEPRV